MVNNIKSIEGNKLIDTYNVEGHTSAITYSSEGFKINDKLTLGVDTTVHKLNNVSRSIYTQTTSMSVSNTTIETSFLTPPLILLGGSLNKGDVIRISSYGVYNDTGTPTNTIKIIFGDTILISSVNTLPTISGALFKIEFNIAILDIASRTCSIIGEGMTTIKESGIGYVYARSLLMTTPVIVDTITDNKLDITYTWSVASTSNYVTPYITIIEKL